MFAGEILASAAVIEGKEATAFAAYGSQARGGEVSSYVVIAESEIPSPFVFAPKFLICLSEESYLCNTCLISEETIVIYDSSLIKEVKWEKNHFGIPATECVQEVSFNPPGANMVLLGTFSAITSIILLDSLRNALKDRLKGRILETNLLALKEGYNLVKSKLRRRYDKNQ